MIAVATVVPAFAWTVYQPEPASSVCSAPAGADVYPEIDIIQHSFDDAQIGNTSGNDCYALYTKEYVTLYGGAYYSRGGIWVAGYPGKVDIGIEYVDVKNVENQFNFCSANYTTCWGFSSMYFP
jgi:hypothetical protein